MNLPQQMPFDVLSVGKAACELRAPASRVLEVAAALGIEPQGRINGVTYFSAADVERIALHVHRTSQGPTPGIVTRNPMF